MFNFSKQSLSIPAIWQNAFELYKTTITKIWYLALVMMAIAFSSNAIIPAPKVVSSDSMHHMVAQLPTHYGVGSVLYSVVASLLALFFFAVIIHRMATLIEKPDIEVKDSVKHVLARYIILVISMVAIYIPIMIGVLLLIVPGVFLGILFIFNSLFVIFEDASWLEAIKMSCKLVWGNWWRTFGAIVVPAIVVGIIQHFVAGLFSFNPWVYLVVTAILLAFLHPYLDGVLLVQFNDLKVRQGEEPETVAKATTVQEMDEPHEVVEDLPVDDEDNNKDVVELGVETKVEKIANGAVVDEQKSEHGKSSSNKVKVTVAKFDEKSDDKTEEASESSEATVTSTAPSLSEKLREPMPKHTEDET